ncbi:MAG TPA: thioredoxin-dependent thiol peroxidase [Armatimonadota bacterium]|jgi:peroxiredoxin Q/BCP
MEPGQIAPDFRLTAVDADGEREVTLADFRGRPLVLYFYPKDDTPGCTREACSFRDLGAEFEAHGVAILGISPDTASKHSRFIGKYTLPFPLLADEDHSVCEAYGVWKEKVNYGKTYMGFERTTFLIDGDGVIRRVWPKVKVEGHVEAVLAAIEG